MVNQIIWGYANITCENYGLRCLFNDLNIPKNIHFAVKNLDERNRFKPELLTAFVVFLSYYFGTEPQLEFEKVR